MVERNFSSVVLAEAPIEQFPKQLFTVDMADCGGDEEKIREKLIGMKEEAKRRQRIMSPFDSDMGWAVKFAENGWTKALKDRRRYPLHPNPKEYSEKFITRTQKGFYEDIDNALEAHNLDQQKLQKALSEKGTDGVMEAFFPAYVDLVVQGYKPYKDLNA